MSSKTIEFFCLLDIGDVVKFVNPFAAVMEQIYRCDSDSFFARLDEHDDLHVIHRGQEAQVYRGLLQFVRLSYHEIGDELLVRFRPSITLIGLMMLSSILVATAFVAPWWWLIVEVILLTFALIVNSSQLTWELLQFTQEPITLRTHSSSNG